MAKIRVTQDGTTVVVSNGDKVLIDIPGGGTVNIVADPGSNVKKVTIEFRGDDHADQVVIDLATFSSYDLHIDVRDYDPNDSVVLLSAFNRYVAQGDEDEYNFSYIGSNGATFNGFLHAKDKGEKDFTANPPPLTVCLTEGTLVDTDLGPTPIEALGRGDLVATRDNGLQPIRWIGRRKLDSLELTRLPHLLPVRFRQGSLGHGLPYRDLLVSPQHRMLASDWRAELHFGTPEVLAPAVGFINGRDILREADVPHVVYYHLLFDAHEIITANGAPTESLHSGDLALTSLDRDAMAELRLIFPDAPQLAARRTARPVARRLEAQAALARTG